MFIDGIQYADGQVSREIAAHQLHADEPITVRQAVQLAMALIQAAAAASSVDGGSSK